MGIAKHISRLREIMPSVSHRAMRDDELAPPELAERLPASIIVAVPPPVADAALRHDDNNNQVVNDEDEDENNNNNEQQQT